MQIIFLNHYYTKNNNTDHQIPTESELAISNRVVLLNVQLGDISSISDKIKSYSVFFVEHNMENSKILSQALVIRDLIKTDL